MQHFFISRNKTTQRNTILLICLCVPLSCFHQPALASPIQKVATRTQNTDAFIRVKDLAGQSIGGASELRPWLAPWDWSNPVTTLSQTPPQVLPKENPPENLSKDVDQDTNILLDEVNVTATRRPTRERETTAATYIVSKADIKATGAVTVTDALVLVPGIQFAPALGGVRNFGNNYQRGFNDQRLLILKDGLLFNRPDNGSSDVSRFSIGDVERIEVVSGGSVLRYGPGAVGGVINIITETPSGSPKLTLEYQNGSYGFSRYLGKYGGGDDTFSYNLIFSSVVAFNDYPYSFTLPNRALFYDVTDFTPLGIPLYGRLKPEVGPPLVVNGRADNAYAASDTYSGKFVFKVDPSNSVTLGLSQQNSKNGFVSPGLYAKGGICRGGLNKNGNGTLSGTRFLPLDRNGNQLSCDTQRYLAQTPTTVFSDVFYGFNASADGRTTFPTGQSYPSAEQATGNSAFNEQSLQTQTNASISWNYAPSAILSLKSYVSYIRISQAVYQPDYTFNTNILAPVIGLTEPGKPASINVVAPIPFADITRLEAQSVLDAMISPGQVLSLGVNFSEDRSLTKFNTGSFSDEALSKTSIFLIDDISLGPELNLNIGTRATFTGRFGTNVVPAAGLRYSPNSIFSFRANYSEVFALPPIDELLTFEAGAPFASNSNLKPETGATYDIGVDITPASNLGLRFTYFSTYIDNFRTAVTEPNANPASSASFPLIFRSQNVGSRYSSGLEFAGDWQITKEWRLKAAWTNTDVRSYGGTDSVDQASYPFFFQYQDPGVPFNSIAVALTYSNRSFLATLLARYDSGKRRGFAGGSIPQGGEQFTSSWVTLDLNFEIPITQSFTAIGSISNITDTQYEYLSGVPAPGTTFRLGGRLEFGF
jgi:iron complex outermembrane recepter protein